MTLCDKGIKKCRLPVGRRHQMRGLIPLCFLCPQLASRRSRRADNSLISAFILLVCVSVPDFILAAVFAALPVYRARCPNFMSVAPTRQTFVMIACAMAASCGAFVTPVFCSAKNFRTVACDNAWTSHQSIGLDRTETVLWYAPPTHQLAIEQTHGEYAWIAAN